MRKLSLVLCAVLLLGGCGLGADETLEQTEKADELLLETNLRAGFAAEEAYFAQNDKYTTDLSELNISVSAGLVLTIPRADANTFCIQVSDGDRVVHRSPEDDGIQEGPC